MTVKKKAGTTADEFVKATLEMIEDKGGSRDVNLRAVSRAIGCAHTNVYNYFEDFNALLWSAYREAIRIYGAHLVRELEEATTDRDYVERVLRNLATFSVDRPGLYRFINTDPLSIDDMPGDIMDYIGSLRDWFIQVIRLSIDGDVTEQQADDSASILIAYVSGEATDLINGRMLPGEDIAGRMVGNALRLYRLMATEMDPSFRLSDLEQGRRIDFPVFMGADTP